MPGANVTKLTLSQSTPIKIVFHSNYEKSYAKEGIGFNFEYRLSDCVTEKGFVMF